MKLGELRKIQDGSFNVIFYNLSAKSPVFEFITGESQVIIMSKSFILEDSYQNESHVIQVLSSMGLGWVYIESLR